MSFLKWHFFLTSGWETNKIFVQILQDSLSETTESTIKGAGGFSRALSSISSCVLGGQDGASVPRQWKTEPHVLWSDWATPPPETSFQSGRDASHDNLIPAVVVDRRAVELHITTTTNIPAVGAASHPRVDQVFPFTPILCQPPE